MTATASKCDAKSCRHCEAVLVVGENWTPSQAKFRNYRCKTCASAATKKWAESNPDYFKTYYENNSDRMKASAKEWRERNPGYIREYIREYRMGLRRRQRDLQSVAETA